LNLARENSKRFKNRIDLVDVVLHCKGNKTTNPNPVADPSLCGPEVVETRLGSVVANKDEYAQLVAMHEGRKRVILIAACILAARKLSQWDGTNSPASESAIALAERIMAKIDSRWPVP
jgi:hypothetical protein